MNEIVVEETRGSDMVLDSLVMAGHMIEQRVEAALQPHGLSVAKFSALLVLARAEEPIALGVLSQQLHCVRSNITQLVDRLEADKLAQRVPDPEDRRSVRAVITEEGRRRYQVGAQAMQEAQQEILSALPVAERDALSRILGRLLMERVD